MEYVQFNQEDIADLATKISETTQELTPKEKLLLLAVFAAAADRATVIDRARGLAELPVARISDPELTHGELKLQLLRAHTPGKYFDQDTRQFSVIGGIDFPPPSSSYPEDPDQDQPGGEG